MKDIFDQALERVCPDCNKKVMDCKCDDPKWLSEPERTWLKSFRAGLESGHFEEIIRGAYCDKCGTILFEGRYYQCDCYGRGTDKLSPASKEALDNMKASTESGEFKKVLVDSYKEEINKNLCPTCGQVYPIINMKCPTCRLNIKHEYAVLSPGSREFVDNMKVSLKPNMLEAQCTNCMYENSTECSRDNEENTGWGVCEKYTKKENFPFICDDCLYNNSIEVCHYVKENRKYGDWKICEKYINGIKFHCTPDMIEEHRKINKENQKENMENYLKVVMDHTMINKMEEVLVNGIKKREVDSPVLCPSCVYEYMCPTERTLSNNVINCNLFEYSGKESVSNESKDVNEYKVIEDIVKWYNKEINFVSLNEDVQYGFHNALDGIKKILKYHGLLE